MTDAQRHKIKEKRRSSTFVEALGDLGHGALCSLTPFYVVFFIALAFPSPLFSLIISPVCNVSMCVCVCVCSQILASHQCILDIRGAERQTERPWAEDGVLGTSSCGVATCGKVMELPMTSSRPRPRPVLVSHCCFRVSCRSSSFSFANTIQHNLACFCISHTLPWTPGVIASDVSVGDVPF